MKKTSILLMISLLFTLFVVFNCAKKEDLVTPKYQTLKLELKEKMKTIKTREAYQAYNKDRTEKLNALLAEAVEAPEMDSITLLQGNIDLDLRKYDAAVGSFDKLIEKNAVNIFDAKYGKLTAFIFNRKGEEALKIYQELKSNPEFKTKEGVGTLLTRLSYSVEDKTKKNTFINEVLLLLGDSKEDQSNKATIYNMIATFKKDDGKLEEAIVYLKDAKTKITEERAVKSINSTLIHMELIGQEAPAFSAENWLNSKSLDLSKLKGKVVLLDFWAPWCAPCRAVIPHLAASYEKHNKNGLVVIGITKLYGTYRDDKIDKGKVEPDEERKLIEEFLPRFKITYPIAIADTGAPFESYGVRGIPTLVVIDKEGKVNKIQVGSGSEEELEERVLELLQK